MGVVLAKPSSAARFVVGGTLATIVFIRYGWSFGGERSCHAIDREIVLLVGGSM